MYLSLNSIFAKCNTFPNFVKEVMKKYAQFEGYSELHLISGAILSG